MVLGQEQDGFNSGFSVKQSLRGSLTNVNLWSYMLPQDEIKKQSKNVRKGGGISTGETIS